MKTNGGRLFAVITFLSAVILSASGAAGDTARAAAQPPGPFVTFLFSRTEVGAAQDCVPGPGAASLTQVTAPYLQSLGLTATGTVNTLATSDAEGCVHYHESISASWPDLQQLGSEGWTFIPHEYDTPRVADSLTPAQQYQVTCGQRAALWQHGLAGAGGMIAYPGAQQHTAMITHLQRAYGSECFDWGRLLGGGVTSAGAASTFPFWQFAMNLKGGPGQGSAVYTDPAQVIAEIGSLQPGQWLTIEAYVLVTGTSPAGDKITWDCTGAQHVTSDVERYCYSDFQQIAQAAAAAQAAGKITVTSPGAVAAAWGRHAG